jgi:hypothetical protein
MGESAKALDRLTEGRGCLSIGRMQGWRPPGQSIVEERSMCLISAP